MSGTPEEPSEADESGSSSPTGARPLPRYSDRPGTTPGHTSLPPGDDGQSGIPVNAPSIAPNVAPWGIGAGVGIGCGACVLALFAAFISVVVAIGNEQLPFGAWTFLWPWLITPVASVVLMCFKQTRGVGTGMLIVSFVASIVAIVQCSPVL